MEYSKRSKGSKDVGGGSNRKLSSPADGGFNKRWVSGLLPSEPSLSISSEPASQPASAEQETDFIIPKLHSYISTSTLSLPLHGLLFNCYTIHSVGADAITSKKIVRLLRSVFWHLALLISHQVGSDL